jgi:hypothetical protein
MTVYIELIESRLTAVLAEIRGRKALSARDTGLLMRFKTERAGDALFDSREGGAVADLSIIAR